MTETKNNQSQQTKVEGKPMIPPTQKTSGNVNFVSADNTPKDETKNLIEEIRFKLLNGQECNEPYYLQTIAMDDFSNKEAILNSSNISIEKATLSGRLAERKRILDVIDKFYVGAKIRATSVDIKQMKDKIGELK